MNMIFFVQRYVLILVFVNSSRKKYNIVQQLKSWNGSIYLAHAIVADIMYV